MAGWLDSTRVSHTPAGLCVLNELFSLLHVCAYLHTHTCVHTNTHAHTQRHICAHAHTHKIKPDLIHMILQREQPLLVDVHPHHPSCPHCTWIGQFCSNVILASQGELVDQWAKQLCSMRKNTQYQGEGVKLSWPYSSAVYFLPFCANLQLQRSSPSAGGGEVWKWLRGGVLGRRGGLTQSTSATVVFAHSSFSTQPWHVPTDRKKKTPKESPLFSSTLL